MGIVLQESHKNLEQKFIFSIGSLNPHSILYNYPPKGRWILYTEWWIYTKTRSVKVLYPPLFTDPEGDSCFSIYQIRWIKKRFYNFFF